MCFQKIIKIDYAIPEGFNEVAADLVSKLLVRRGEGKGRMEGRGDGGWKGGGGRMEESMGTRVCFLALSLDVQVSDHTQRPGCEAAGGYPELKKHPFFHGIDWVDLPEQEPPKILPYLPSNTKDGEALKSNYDVSTTCVLFPVRALRACPSMRGSTHSIQCI